MSRPGTRRFIGPLTPAQKRRRERARQHFSRVAERADTRNITIREALKIEGTEEWYRGIAP